MPPTDADGDAQDTNLVKDTYVKDTFVKADQYTAKDSVSDHIVEKDTYQKKDTADLGMTDVVFDDATQVYEDVSSDDNLDSHEDFLADLIQGDGNDDVMTDLDAVSADEIQIVDTPVDMSPGSKAIGERCESNSECQTLYCYQGPFMSPYHFCTKVLTGLETCPAGPVQYKTAVLPTELGGPLKICMILCYDLATDCTPLSSDYKTCAVAKYNDKSITLEAVCQF
jgi:hypothetical protein